MELFLKASAGVLISVILYIILSKNEKNMALILSVAVCCIIGAAAMAYFKPIIDFLYELRSIGDLDGELLQVLLKSVGIGLLAEIVGLVCTDAGNAAMGKILQLLGSALILWLSLPLLRSLIELVREILGGI